jgi:surfactin synthase thioesterase subunit
MLENPELMKLVIPIFRADLSVCETYTYVPEPPLRCPIVAFGGCEDPETTEAGLARWCSQTTGEFSLHMFPGDQFFFRSQGSGFLSRLGEALRPLLDPWSIRRSRPPAPSASRGSGGACPSRPR